jgi:hypothetical protein
MNTASLTFNAARITLFATEIALREVASKCRGVWRRGASRTASCGDPMKLAELPRQKSGGPPRHRIRSTPSSAKSYRNPHGGPAERGVAGFHPSGLSAPARRRPSVRRAALQNDEGLVRHPQNPKSAVVDGHDESAFVLLGAYLRVFQGHVVSGNYSVTVCLPAVHQRGSRTACASGSLGACRR